MTKYFYYFFILFSICLFSPFSLNASGDEIELSKGQRVYVPAYSHIYSGNKERPFQLTVTLSIRNIDPTHLIIESIMIGAQSGQGISFTSRGREVLAFE